MDESGILKEIKLVTPDKRDQYYFCQYNSGRIDSRISLGDYVYESFDIHNTDWEFVRAMCDKFISEENMVEIHS